MGTIRNFRKGSGYTLVEMVLAIGIIGIAFPIIINVLINSYDNLAKIQRRQLIELQHQQLRGRINTDFDNIYRIFHLSSDSISFSTLRNNTFQDIVEYYFSNDTLYYKVNRSSKKILFKNFFPEQTRFQFQNYNGTPELPDNGISYSAPEMNNIEKIIFSYSFRSVDNIYSGKITRLKKRDE